MVVHNNLTLQILGVPVEANICDSMSLNKYHMMSSHQVSPQLRCPRITCEEAGLEN